MTHDTLKLSLLTNKLSAYTAGIILYYLYDVDKRSVCQLMCFLRAHNKGVTFYQ